MPSFKFASATGSGSSLIVTCSDQFAGKTITCTNGTKTYTRTCPSTSPYEVVFKGIAPGTWTVSGVVEGTTYSQQVVITDFDVTLTADFDYKQWVTLGGLDPTDYASLSEVFADEVAVRRLMTIHASADYLIEKVTDDVDTIDDFTANDTAMKWIGLRDYVCDGLTAITGVETKFLASEYWERYLKDHVPVMTSNTAPYGTALTSPSYTSMDAWYSFDNNTNANKCGLTTGTTNGYIQYQFTNPTKVERVTIKELGNSSQIAVNSLCKDIEFYVSYDGTNFEKVGEATNSSPTLGKSYTHDVTTPKYGMYFRIKALNNNGASSYTEFGKLQFYGRSLNVSVPVMTSNTAPYGEASASSILSSTNDSWKAFDKNTSTRWCAGGSSQGQISGRENQYVQYKFTNKKFIKQVSIKANYENNGLALKNFKVQASNDGTTFVDVYTGITEDADKLQVFDIEPLTSYIYWRLFGVDTWKEFVSIYELQFYGVDYSEREFAEGSTMKYLYDHGVELEDIDYSIKTSGNISENDGESIIVTQTQSSGNSRAIVNSAIDLTPYNYYFTRVGNELVGTTALRVFGNKTATDGGVATMNIAPPITCLLFGLSVSSVNQSCYPSIYSESINVKIKVTEWWLE